MNPGGSKSECRLYGKKTELIANEHEKAPHLNQYLQDVLASNRTFFLKSHAQMTVKLCKIHRASYRELYKRRKRQLAVQRTVAVL